MAHGHNTALMAMLAPLIGSIFFPELLPLFGAGGTALAGLGGGAVASGIGGGLGTLLATRDPKQALMSGLLTGGAGALLGGLGGTAGKAASTAATAAPDAAAVLASNPNIASTIANIPGAAGAAAAKTAAASSPLSSVLGFVGRHPMLTTAALGIPALLPSGDTGPAPSTHQDIPENFPTQPGPRSGYAQSTDSPMSLMSDYLNYGKPSGRQVGEYQFFHPASATAPSGGGTGAGGSILDPGAGGGGANAGGFGGSSGFGGLMNNQDIQRLIQEMMSRQQGFGSWPSVQALKGGGLVVGPGGPTDDMVPAQAHGRPIQLSNGEYVMPAKAVQAAGGPGAMDKLRRRLVKHHVKMGMQDGGPVNLQPLAVDGINLQDDQQPLPEPKAPSEPAPAAPLGLRFQMEQIAQRNARAAAKNPAPRRGVSTRVNRHGVRVTIRN